METPDLAPDSFVEPPAPKKSNKGLIIAIIVVLVLCCCCVLGIGGWWAWNNGDTLMKTSMALHLV